MRQRHGWRRLLLCGVLELAALMGAPIRPKDIEDALRPASTYTMQQQQRRKETSEVDPIIPLPLLHTWDRKDRDEP